MGVEAGNYIDDLVITNPLSSDPVSEGDDQLRLIKKVVKQSFPSVDSAVHAIHTGAEPTTSVTAGLVWFDTSANVLKIRNEDNDAWVTLAVSIVTSNSVDINAGTIDGATIGAASPSTAVVSSLNVNSDGATVTGIKNEDDLASDSDTKLATQGSIKAYVDSKVTAEDLDISTDTGGPIAIDLDSETLAISGGEGIDTSSTGNTVTIAGEDATTSNKGVASFSSDNFGVSSGAVTIKDGGVANAELADMAANTVKVRNANSSGVPSDLALATTEIMIGDGTGFTAAALSGDVTMTNAGVVNVAKITGEEIDTDAVEDDQVLKYSTTTSKWMKVNSLPVDKCNGIGQLITFNGTSDTRWAGGTTTTGALNSSYNGKVLTADSTLTYGMDWKENTAASAGFAVAMAIAL
tara:strand:+ start:116 stop:1336 length:1221 start_codon:yes stop_codon:yes gene_type:complete